MTGARLFQSSPSPKAGSYNQHLAPAYRRLGFNPLPARRPGATAPLAQIPPDAEVSILSQPEGRELLREAADVLVDEWFQSSPSPKAGSYGLVRLCCITYIVSILSQPEGRELPTLFEGLVTGLVFQSSPSPKAGSYVTCFTLCLLLLRFQSSPSPKAGSYQKSGAGRSNCIRFNPLPARRPGATRIGHESVCDDYVSILSQPEGRELHLSGKWAGAGYGVSILSQPEGRELPQMPVVL